jgi:hypothetical protein
MDRRDKEAVVTFRLLLACGVLSSLCAIGGCKDTKPVEPPEPRINQPKLGVPCTVQFRRDSLGFYTEKTVIGPMESGAASGQVSLSGVIIEANEQWIVLDNVEQTSVVLPDGKHPISTVWIRFDNVLLISYDKK